MSQKLYYTWQDFENDVKYLVMMLKDKNIECVVGLPRGGLPLAVKLSNVLDVPLKLTISEACKYATTKNRILIVDDIADRGDTFNKIPYRKCYTTLTLFLREGSKFIPNFWAVKVNGDRWISFPWENTVDVKEERDGTFRNIEFEIE